MAPRQRTCALLVFVVLFIIRTDVKVSAQGSGTVPAALFDYLERMKTVSTAQQTPTQTSSTSQQAAPQPNPPPPSGAQQSQADMYSQLMQMMRDQQQNTAQAPPPVQQPPPPQPQQQQQQQQVPPFDPFSAPVQQQQQPPQQPMQMSPVQMAARQPPPPTQAPPKPAKPVIEFTRTGKIDFVPSEHKAQQPAQYQPQPHQLPASHYYNAATNRPAYYTRPQQHTNAPNWGAHAAPVRMPYRRPAPPTRTQASKPQSWTSRMVLSPSMHNKLMAQAKQSGLTRHYEEHGCIDPVMYMPPGSTTMGLAMGCSNRMSQQLCQMAGRRVPGAAAGKSNNMAMMMMFAPPHMKQLMETCLSRTTLTKAMFGMARGGRGGGGGMDPAAMAMIMGGAGGGGGGGMMSAMMMMNMMGNRNQQSPVSTSTSTSSSQGSLPAGAALPGGGPQPTRQGGYAAQRQSPPQSMSSKCASILPFVMMQGGEGGLMTPEGGDIVRDLRRQMFPYTCQEVGAGMMPVRMCCPGKVNHPSMFEFISSAGAGA